jgi:hypothetical protein
LAKQFASIQRPIRRTVAKANFVGKQQNHTESSAQGRLGEKRF